MPDMWGGPSDASCALITACFELRRSAVMSRLVTTAARRASPTNSCRDRHCPKCVQGAARTQWRLEDRQGELLPVPYFHVVFTLPPPIAAIAFQNKAAVYAILSQEPHRGHDHAGRQSAELGAKVGGLAILHTWGQALTHHLPRPLCRAGRRTFPRRLAMDRGARELLSRRQAAFPAVPPPVPRTPASRLRREGPRISSAISRSIGPTQPLSPPIWPPRAMGVDWIVHAKKPFGGPAQVLAYLGRYTHRVAIANSRIQACDDDHVAFNWKDYRDGGARQDSEG